MWCLLIFFLYLNWSGKSNFTYRLGQIWLSPCYLKHSYFCATTCYNCPPRLAKTGNPSPTWATFWPPHVFCRFLVFSWVFLGFFGGGFKQFLGLLQNFLGAITFAIVRFSKTPSPPPPMIVDPDPPPPRLFRPENNYDLKCSTN